MNQYSASSATSNLQSNPVVFSSSCRSPPPPGCHPQRVLNFLSPSFMDVTVEDHVANNGTDHYIPFGEGTPSVPPIFVPYSVHHPSPVRSSTSRGSDIIRRPPLFSPAFAYVYKDDVTYRATVLFHVKMDPKFLSLIPIIFPIPPWGNDILYTDNPVDALAVYIQQLISMYPPHLTAETWFHLRLDPEGILPFVPCLTRRYDPSDLSRFLSTDLPQNLYEAGRAPNPNVFNNIFPPQCQFEEEFPRGGSVICGGNAPYLPKRPFSPDLPNW